VGILTGPESGIWVLDIDVKSCNGFETLRDLFHGHGVTDVPSTFRAVTPSGGQHWYFRYPRDGRKIRNIVSPSSRPGPLGPGLDVRGWHGMVVAPDQGARRIIDYSEPADAPDWLAELATARPRERLRDVQAVDTDTALVILDRTAERLARTTVGGRNDALNRAAFALGALGSMLNEDTTRAALLRACEVNGLATDDGEKSFNDTFRSGWAAGLEAGARNR
jgi:hypothetical protein